MSSEGKSLGSPTGVTRRGFLKYAVAGAAVAGAAAVGGSAYYKYSYLPSARPVEITLGATVPATTGVVLSIIQSQGFAKKNNLDASFNTFTSVEAQTAALLKGSLDVAYGAQIGSLAVGAASGSPLQIIFGATQSSNSILVRKDSSYNSVADLKGTTVGTPYSVPLAYNVAIYVLKTKGVAINYGDLKYVTSPMGTLSNFLDNGQIVAAEVIDPILAQMNATGKYRVLSAAADEWKSAGNGILYGAAIAINANYGQSHARAVTAAIQTWVDGVKYVRSNISSIDDFIKNNYKITDPGLVSAIEGKFLSQLQPFAWDDAEVTGLTKLLQMYKESGALPSIPANFFPTSFASGVSI